MRGWGYLTTIGPRSPYAGQKVSPKGTPRQTPMPYGKDTKRCSALKRCQATKRAAKPRQMPCRALWHASCYPSSGGNFKHENKTVKKENWRSSPGVIGHGGPQLCDQHNSASAVPAASQDQRDRNRDRNNRNQDRNRDNNRGRGRRSNDDYPNWGGSFQLRQTALNAGYNEGIKEGRKDRKQAAI